jgi:hypothetical protein
MEAKLYKVTGEVIDVEPKNGKYFLLEEMQSFVKGYIEILRLNNNTIMVLNEEGKLLGQSVNIKANDVFQQAFKLSNDYIVGDVLICDKKLVR